LKFCRTRYALAKYVFSRKGIVRMPLRDLLQMTRVRLDDGKANGANFR
jgi:hypothetical protein